MKTSEKRGKSPSSVRIRENTDQNNTVFGHFSSNEIIIEIQVKELRTESSLTELTPRDQGFQQP